MTSKMRIKVGQVEIEYEGSENFLKEELPALLKAISELYKESASRETNLGTYDVDSKTKADAPKEIAKISLSTNSIAAKVGCSSGTDLVLAAATHLTFVKGVEPFSRKQLLEEMKSAKSYYKASFMNNLSATMDRLLKDQKLLESSPDAFSLSAPQRKVLESKLA